MIISISYDYVIKLKRSPNNIMKESERLTFSVNNSLKYGKRPWLTIQVDLVLPSENCSAVALLENITRKQLEKSLFIL